MLQVVQRQITAGRGCWLPRLRQRDWLPYAMVAPVIALVGLISIYPAYTAIQVSLFDTNLLRMSEAHFVGLGNFARLLQDDIFLGGIWRTLRWTGTTVIAQLLLGLAVALFLNQHFPGRGFLRALILIPWVISPAVTSIIWVYLFDANFGVVNYGLRELGLLGAPIPWSSDETGSFVMLVMAMIWTGFPFMAVVLLAALQALPEEVYDAARIDGAGPWQRFRFVTFPQLLPTILLLLLLRSMWMAHHVDIIYLITDGGPGIANNTLAVYAFRLTSIDFQIGYASAVALVLGVVLLIGSRLYVRHIEKSMDYL